MLFFNFGYSQKEGNNWYFGTFAGLNFNSGTPVALTNSAMRAEYGCSTMSDHIGNLLFYSDGATIWNRNHDTMLNGSGLFGSTAATQSGVSVPLPGSNHIYYIFSICGGNCLGLSYSMIDMNLDNGVGAVYIKNIPLKAATTEKITAIRHSNNSAIWIITHEWKTNAFYAYLLTSLGLSTSPVISYCGRNHGPNYLIYGYMKVSPDGRKIAVAVEGAFTQLFDFDPSTGIVSNPVTLRYQSNDISGYGIEFSPNGKSLYVSSNISKDTSYIFQFNIKNPNASVINNSCKIIAFSNSVNIHFDALQVAPDRKIYISAFTNLYLCVINNPNDTGNSCGYVYNALYLNGKGCQRGLPTFLQSYFFVPDFTLTPQCLGDSTHFALTDTSQIDSVHWKFGEPSSGINNTSNVLKPSHLYSDTGWYNIQVIVFHSTGIDTSSRNIRIDHYPSASFAINDTISCLKGNNFIFTNLSIIQSGNMTFVWDFGDSTTGFTTNISHSYSKDSTFNVRLVALSDYGCADTFYKKLFIKPSPTAYFTINDRAQCSKNNLFSFKNTSNNTGIVSKLWSFGDGQTDTTTNTSHTYSTEDNFLVKLLLVNSSGCTDTAKKMIQVFHTPRTNFSINDSLQCLKGNFFAFSNQTKNIHQDTLYFLWNFGDSSSDTATNTVHKYTRADTFNVRISVITNNGCKDSLNKKLQVNNQPVASFSLIDSSQCFTVNSFIFINNSNYSKGSFNSLWDFGDGITDTTKSPKHSYNYDSIFTVKLRIQTAEGCTDSFLKQVIVNPQPKADFSINDISQCLFGNSFNFQNLTSGILQKTSWEFGDGNSDTSTNTSHKYSVEDNFNVSLIATNLDGCKDSIIKQIIVNKRPNISFIINDSSQCLSGNSFNYSNTTTGKNIFQWSFGDGQSDTSKNTTHSYSTAGNYKITLHTTNKEGCTDSISKTIIIFQQPKAGFTINDSIQCLKGNNFLLNNNTTGTNKYYWDFGDSKTDTNNNSSHTYSSTGTFNIKLFVTSLDKCSDSIIKQINILPKPISGFGVNDSIQCLKSNKFHFNNSTTGANSYKWDFGDGNSDTILNPTHTYLINGIFNTNLISQSAGGCKDTSKLTITVLEVPTAAFSVNDTSQILPGNSFVFSNLTNCKPASSTCKYLWDFGDGQSDTISNPTHNYKAIGMYHVLLTATSTNGCKDTVSLNVYVTNIIVLIAFTVKDVCFGDLAYFKNSSTIQYDSFMNFLWDFGDGNTIIRPNPQHMYADTGTYKVQLVSLSYGGFRDTANGKVRVLSSPTVKIIATPDSILDQGLKATLSANGTFDSLLWSTGAITASIIVEKSGIYSIRVVDFNGCDAVDSITIEYLPEKPFSAMNVITPNDDGYNDVWKVSDIDQYRPCKVRIFNRWGDELYSSGDYQNNWAGTYKGKKLPEGTYYYVLETKDGVVYKGAINILKK